MNGELPKRPDPPANGNGQWAYQFMVRLESRIERIENRQFQILLGVAVGLIGLVTALLTT